MVNDVRRFPCFITGEAHFGHRYLSTQKSCTFIPDSLFNNIRKRHPRFATSSEATTHHLFNLPPVIAVRRLKDVRVYGFISSIFPRKSLLFDSTGD